MNDKARFWNRHTGFLAREHAHQLAAKAIWGSLAGALAVATMLDCAPGITLAKGMTPLPATAPAVTQVTGLIPPLTGQHEALSDAGGAKIALAQLGAGDGTQTLDPQATSLRGRKSRRR